MAYNCFASIDIRWVGDITGIYAYTLQQCIDACSTMNEVAGEIRCVAAAIGEDISGDYQLNKGANCWLKSRTDPMATADGIKLAVLRL